MNVAVKIGLVGKKNAISSVYLQAEGRRKLEGVAGHSSENSAV